MPIRSIFQSFAKGAPNNCRHFHWLHFFPSIHKRILSPNFFIAPPLSTFILYSLALFRVSLSSGLAETSHFSPYKPPARWPKLSSLYRILAFFWFSSLKTLVLHSTMSNRLLCTSMQSISLRISSLGAPNSVNSTLASASVAPRSWAVSQTNSSSQAPPRYKAPAALSK
jgi:hypothetical protein